jgi:hypothetical protein
MGSVEKRRVMDEGLFTNRFAAPSLVIEGGTPDR